MKVLRIILSMLSLLLLIATISLWVRSHWLRDELTITRTTRFYISSDRGSLSVLRQWFTEGPRQGPQHFSPLDPEPLELSSAPVDHRFSPPSWDYSAWPVQSLATSTGVLCSHGISIGFPYYLPALVSLVLPSLSILNVYRRRSRLKRNLCANCAYDLRASSDKCPECGTPVPATQRSALNV